ncbi:hypothetical protein Tdes44962_MAKER01582 [Teratosphaeria destructans]|uniref:Uncharacterized protein n=1 Tax=Teratosphaeria destructans TaxID=418781 RepID=A0A9W7SYC5_9PEZI|nr:hypothetical protein Tdes44962_MAKER01582 [Teratosphaeria destructans]
MTDSGTGRFQELQTEILALQKYALPPTQEDANGFMADFHQGLTEPMEARFKTMARIVGKGSGSDAKKSMEKPDGIGEDLDDGSDSEDSL